MDLNINFNLSEFTSIMLQYFSFVDEYAKKVREGKVENKVFVKDINDYFTELDYLSQTLLLNIFKKFYPYKNFLIIAEETITEDYNKKIIDLTNKDKSLFLSNLNNISLDKNYFNFPKEFNNKTIDLTNSEVSIFVDPIDGTKSLVKGIYEPVTILLGICINNKPFMGFIHFVFSENNKTFFNFPSLGIYEYSPSTRIILKKEIKVDDNKYNFVISNSRYTKEMIDFIKTFPNNEYENVSGLGSKAIKCILEDKIYFTTSKNSLSLWDICAPSCILNELGLDIYCFNGEKVKFVPKRMTFDQNGVICISPKKLQVFLEHVKKYYSQAL